MGSNTDTSASMILLVLALATTVGLFTYFMAGRTAHNYEAPRVAIPSPARPPGM